MKSTIILRTSLVIFCATACMLMLSACGNVAGDKADNNVPLVTPAAGNQSSVVAPNSPSPAVPSANTTDKAIQQGTPQMSNNNARVSSVPKPQIGTGGNDFFQFTQARAAIGADPELNATNIVIDVKAGVLTLSGTVASAAQKSKAEQLVRAVAGVKEVKNRLRTSN